MNIMKQRFVKYSFNPGKRFTAPIFNYRNSLNKFIQFCRNTSPINIPGKRGKISWRETFWHDITSNPNWCTCIQLCSYGRFRVITNKWPNKKITGNPRDRVLKVSRPEGSRIWSVSGKFNVIYNGKSMEIHQKFGSSPK